MNRIQIKSNNIIFPNPFILASSPISRNAEMIMRAFDAGWGGAVTKTICLDPETMINATPRMLGFKPNAKIIGLNNIELITERPLKDWLEDIKIIKSNYPENVLIASIMAEATSIEKWQELASKVEHAGADIIELNLSCPNGVPDREMGSFCSEIPEVCAEIIKGVKLVSNLPVWAKLSPNITDISQLVYVCLKAGADGIVAINTVKGFSGIDIETLKPKLNVNGMSTYGGFSGEFIKPFALKAVSEISANHNCEISATGGISNWKDSVEFMLLGASTLQICTEVMFKGFGIIEELKNGLESYLDRKNFSSAQTLIGLSLNKISKFDDLDLNKKNVACINNDNCLSCGKCYLSCTDGAYQAISIKHHNNKKFYEVNSDKCTGCGLCQIVCPKNCIEMEVKKQNVFNAEPVS